MLGSSPDLSTQAVSVDVDDNLVLVARTLRLLIEVQELILTNKSLRAVWKERSEGILSMVYKLFIESTG